MPRALDAALVPPLTLYGSLRWDVVERLLPAAPGRVLEVGCGQGAVAVRLAARAASYTGVELDVESARTAEARLASAGVPGAVVHGPLDSLPDAEHFDLVCAFEVIEHIEDDAAALAEWVARLRPGGTVVVSTPAWQSRFGPMDTAVGHFRRYDPPALDRLLRDAGLVDVGQRLYGMPLGYALEAVRNQLAARRPGLREEGSTAERTARSGRLFQPATATQGRLVSAATWPFRRCQRAFPDTGTGLVAWGSAPRAD
ncbi:class I SAM-dependent methyltransferase [Isoptericola sp. NEAU-Y5]|uniref:Class I SAM-dependent methyltransferase n=1 Tax=Isoptericola luteus TaxID=2879484 RepID=A0ABS7ZCL4_9MICO|nr:class I SAM-dependent methyltransferase [Isoptericola sp. NEAU-Y5]MCA5892772.1 class I SAM-dependent methyltransferase [Isoptericola sp. NEAU-Y5]